MSFSPLEIVKLLPKTNCGQCGEVSCLAFAVALAAGKKRPEDCPYLDPEKLPSLGPSPAASEIDQAYRILEEVKKKARALNLAELAPDLGLTFEKDHLLIPYLDALVELTPEKARRQDGQELDPRDQILLYNYLIFHGREPLSGEFVGLETFPNSISKVATLRRYAEEKLAQAFEKDPAFLRKRLSLFRARELPGEADWAVEIWILPRMPLRVYFWEGEPEEGLSSEAKILYDRKALVYLDLESLVFCAERLTERWLGQD